MASPPPESPLSRAAAHAEAAGRSAGAVVSRHRLASGIIAGAAALSNSIRSPQVSTRLRSGQVNSRAT